MLLMASVVRVRQTQGARLLVITVFQAFGQPLKLVDDLKVSTDISRQSRHFVQHEPSPVRWCVAWPRAPERSLTRHVISRVGVSLAHTHVQANEYPANLYEALQKV